MGHSQLGPVPHSACEYNLSTCRFVAIIIPPLLEVIFGVLIMPVPVPPLEELSVDDAT